MRKTIKLTINGISVVADKGMTILDAARKAGVEIPTLCHDERVKQYGACGLCVVETENSPKLLRACATEAAEGMAVLTDTPKVINSRRCALELLLSDHTGDCVAPCSLACPAGTDCQGYVGLIANKETIESAKLIREKLPLPASIGRVCPHPCETACRRRLVEEPVMIAALKRFAGDAALSFGADYLPEAMPGTGKSVAVIGGGPGGLTAAYFLRLKGHKTDIYDMMPQMGGMLRYGIPEYRLPNDVLDKEIAIIKSAGIGMHNNTKIGRDISLEDLKSRCDAVIVAIGAWKSSKMKVSGEELEGVIGGIDFLRDTSAGNPPKIGERVAVCGGGNTAMDACRTAVRLGAKEVSVVYRRSRDEMPADPTEIDEAEEEGVVFRFLTNPDEILGENGKVTGMKLQIMELGEPDASGRRKPVPVKGAFEEILLDTVIMAIGQANDNEGFESLEMTKRLTIAADENTFRTSMEGVFAVGDATNSGADIAISAIGEAQKAAEVIDSYLKGKIIPYKKPFIVESEVTKEDFADRKKVPRAAATILAPQERKNNFQEVASCLSEESAVNEASRCLECGCHDVFECKLLRYAREYDALPARLEGVKRESRRDNEHPYIEQNAEKCILCGLCVRVCDETMGVTAIGLADRGFDTAVSPEFGKPLKDTNCISCGQCAAVCPTGALREKNKNIKSVPVKEKSTITTCPGCAAGCQLELRSIGNTLIRALPAEKNGVLCSEGRFGFIENKTRVLSPLIRRDGVFAQADMDEALEFLVSAVKTMTVKYGAGSLGVSVSPSLTQEDASAVVDFARKTLNAGVVFTFGVADRKTLRKPLTDSETENYRRIFGDKFHTGANSYGLLHVLDVQTLSDIGSIKALIAFGGGLPGGLPSLEFLAVHTATLDTVTEGASLLLPARAFYEMDGTLINSEESVLTVRKAVEPQGAPDTVSLIHALEKRFRA